MNKGDLSAFQAYRNDPEVARYQSWSKLSDTEAAGFLTAMQSEPILAAGEWVQIAIARRADDLLIGDMGWFLSKDQSEAELGITLARSFQQQGFATEALKLAVTEVFARSAAKRIVAYADIRNLPSCALMPRAGFQHIATEPTDGVMEHVFEVRRDTVN